MGAPENFPVVQSAMGRLEVANPLLGDRAALRQAWDRDGYWYFKGVLDPEVIGHMREVWLDYLRRSGLIGGRENRCIASRPLEPLVSAALDAQLCIAEFNQRQVHKILTEDPRINATMKQIRATTRSGCRSRNTGLRRPASTPPGAAWSIRIRMASTAAACG